MRVIHTEDLTPASIAALSESEKLWIYNALDCCITTEVKDVLSAQLDNETRSTYEFAKALQAPVLEMDLRGIKVDMAARDRVVRDLQQKLTKLEAQLDRILSEGLGLHNFNWRSPTQLQVLFYGILQIPPVRWKGKPTVNRVALEKLDAYLYAQPIVAHILKMRDIGKRIGVLRTEVDPDGRLRTSYNIAGTETGRFSSSFSAFGTGTNLQNITDELRNIFISDEGYKLAYIDLAQAESRVVGAIIWNLFEDPTYLDATESGDLHTTICRMAWQHLPWTGDLKQDTEIAERPCYRNLSFRDMSKKLGHGSNYAGTPPTMARHTKLPQKVVAEFQQAYFTAFPGIPRWHTWVAGELREAGKLYTLTNRRRWFFGRRDAAETVREAIAYVPQGTVGDMLNQGMLNVWRAGDCTLLMQIHDAIVVQYLEAEEQRILPLLLKQIEVPLELRGGRILRIPSDAKVGWNWSKWSSTNPDGLKSFVEGKPDARTRSPALSILDRVVG